MEANKPCAEKVEVLPAFGALVIVELTTLEPPAGVPAMGRLGDDDFGGRLFKVVSICCLNDEGF